MPLCALLIDSFFTAARQGLLAVLLDHLEREPLLAQELDASGRTALMICARRGHFQCLPVLAPHSDALAKDEEGATALMWVAQEGHLPSVLLLAGIGDCESDEQWGRALMLAAAHGHAACVEALAPYCEPLASEARRILGLSGAARYMTWDDFHLEDDDTVDLLDWDLDETALLIQAASEGRLIALELLLCESSAQGSDAKGETALMHAATKGHVSCVRALLPGSDLGAVDDLGRTALMHAALNGQMECVALLRRHGDIHSFDARGRNALMLAASQGHIACVEELLPYSDWTHIDDEGECALSLAILAQSPSSVRALLVHRLRVFQAALAWAESTLKPPIPSSSPFSHSLRSVRGAGREIARLVARASSSWRHSSTTESSISTSMPMTNSHFPDPFVQESPNELPMVDEGVSSLLPAHPVASESFEGIDGLDCDARLEPIRLEDPWHAPFLTINPHPSSDLGQSSLFFALKTAARADHLEILELILRVLRAHSINGEGRQHLSEALFVAVQSDSLCCTQALSGLCDPRERDSDGHSLLMLISARGWGTDFPDLIAQSDVLAVSHSGSNALMWAAHRGDAAQCQALLAPPGASAAALACDDEGFSALMLAASAGHLKCVKLLLPLSNPNAIDLQFHRNALMWALLDGWGSCGLALMPMTTPGGRDVDGHTALALAIRACHRHRWPDPSVRWTATAHGPRHPFACVPALARIAEEHAANLQQETPFSQAIFLKMNKIATFLEPFDEAVEPHTYGAAALMLALSHPLTPVCQRFAQRLLPQVASQCTVQGETPLIDAVRNKKKKAIVALLPFCDVRGRNAQGLDALMVAAQGGDIKLLKLLLPASDPNATDLQADNALFHALRAGHTSCAELLMDSTDLHHTNDQGESALLLATATVPLCVYTLLDAGCCAATPDRNGLTPLMNTARHGWHQNIPLLLPHCDPLARDAQGRRAIDWARMHVRNAGVLECVELLASFSKTSIS